jgi:hypothetical protein
VFLETTSGAGLALAFVDAGIKSNYGLIATARSTGSTVMNVDNIPQFYSTYVIEMFLGSGIAAASETMNIQFGSAGGGAGRDTIAANYYSYSGFIANSVAAVSAVQNLGATAALQITAPGSTATNPAFYLVMSIRNANQSGLVKVITGTAFLKIGNANGNLSVINFGGLWSNVTKALEQIQVTTAGANVVGGEINIYGKDGLTT